MKLNIETSIEYEECWWIEDLILKLIKTTEKDSIHNLLILSLIDHKLKLNEEEY